MNGTDMSNPRKSSLRIRLLLGGMLVVVLSFASRANAQMTGLNPTPDEIAQLPQFCWQQMKVPNAIGPQYTWQECSRGNHYCPGLVWLIRAKKQKDMRKAVRMLIQADGMVQYTLRNGPTCSMLSHAQSTAREIEALKSIYGVKDR